MSNEEKEKYSNISSDLHLLMAFKTITITEDAYTLIKRLKHGDESFSDLFKRLGSRQATVKDVLGALKHTPEEARAFADRIKEIRKELNKDFTRRLGKVSAR